MRVKPRPPGAHTKEQMAKYISDYILESVFQGKIRRCHGGTTGEKYDFWLEGEFWKSQKQKNVPIVLHFRVEGV